MFKRIHWWSPKFMNLKQLSPGLSQGCKSYNTTVPSPLQLQPPGNNDNNQQSRHEKEVYEFKAIVNILHQASVVDFCCLYMLSLSEYICACVLLSAGNEETRRGHCIAD